MHKLSVDASQVLDAYLRNRAKENGAKVYNGLFLRSSQKDGPEGAFTVNFSDYTDGGKVLQRTHNLFDLGTWELDTLPQQWQACARVWLLPT